jgi:hypothetical protein
VKLRGPDGALSSEISAVIPSAQIVPLPQIYKFKLPTNHNNSQGTINADGSWTTAYGYCGVILDTVFTGDFTFVLSYSFDGDFEFQKASDHVMISGSSLSTSNFYNNTVNWYSSVGSNFPGYTVAMNHYNYNYGGGTYYTVYLPTTYWQYQRRGNTITLRNSSNGSSWNNIKSETVNSNHNQIICGVAMIYAGVHQVAVVSVGA